MDKPDAPASADKSLMDKIASDPDIINRSVTDTGAAPVAVKPTPQPAAPAPGAPTVPVDERMGTASAAPVMNLLKSETEPSVPVTAPAAAVATGKPAPKPHRRWPAMVAVLVALLGLVGVGYAWWMGRPTPTPVATTTPSPTPSPSPSVSPSPTATPTPTPVATPAPQEVTTPAVAPTADHPQMVTVTAPNGLWLRSTPNSSSKANIIGWMPRGAHVNVDSTGTFWWHGSYGGKTGYFAVSFTR